LEFSVESQVPSIVRQMALSYTFRTFKMGVLYCQIQIMIDNALRVRERFTHLLLHHINRYKTRSKHYTRYYILITNKKLTVASRANALSRDGLGLVFIKQCLFLVRFSLSSIIDRKMSEDSTCRT